MPKLASTLASLLLIASSIGVNAVRYPQVGRAIEPHTATAAESANSPPAASGQLASQNPPVDTSEAGTPAPTPQTIRMDAEQLPPTAPEFQQSPVFAAAPAERAPPPANVTVPIVDVRPMVPVADLTANNGGSAMTVGAVSRLPPVEISGMAASDTDSARPSFASAYPTTATP